MSSVLGISVGETTDPSSKDPKHRLRYLHLMPPLFSVSTTHSFKPLKDSLNVSAVRKQSHE
jgi:hypothetical protein